MFSLPLALLMIQGPQVSSDYPVFETDNLSPVIYQQRRKFIKASLGQNGVALFLTNPTRVRSNDTEFRFRPGSDFRYLTGFEEPDASLLLAPGGINVNGRQVTEVLFVNEADQNSVTWLGYRMGPVNAMKLLGVESAVSNKQFASVIASLPKASPVAKAPVPEDLSGMVESMSKAWTTQTTANPANSVNVRGILSTMRVKKSPEELTLLKKAATASALGHREAMKSVVAGMREWELQAIVEYTFMRNGCESVGYNSIVGSGPNSTILHYEADRRLMRSGDMICMDVAGEYHGYSADVTRSFPVNGKFSPAQRAIYEIVLKAQDAGIAECKAGNQFNAPHVAATKVITEGLMKLGIISSPDEVSQYFMHGTSHYIGLDVHDAHGDNILRPNYTLTVEPGIYIKAGSKCDPKYWNIGVRIEDDILVTDGVPVNLSAKAPRKIADIEALMKKTGIGNLPVGQ